MSGQVQLALLRIPGCAATTGHPDQL